MDRIENHTFDELAIDERDIFVRALTPEDFDRFASAAGALDPDAVESGLVSTNGFQSIAAESGWGGALIAAVIAGRFPGAGTMLVRETLESQGAARPGDVMTLVVSVKAKNAEGRRVVLDCRATNQRGELTLSGVVEVVAPPEKISRRRDRGQAGEVHKKGRRYRRLVEMTRGFAPLRTAVVHPTDEPSLVGAVEAAREGLIEAVLVGPEAKIRRAAEEAHIDLSPFEIVSTEHSHAAAEAAVAMARSGKVEALMKGALHTDELMRAVVDATSGLRTARRVSHVFAIDAPSYPRPLFITDAAVNIYPTLTDKRDIVQNVIDLTRALGIVSPRVAILSAVETVSPDIRSTIDAAALCKMADRGQIVGGILDGPLAFDNAVSLDAARTKGIVSPVAGRADIFVAPDIEAGNMLAKQLEYLADAEMAGVVLGARVPIMLTSRADKTVARLGSCAIALLMARRRVG
ncbi:MAG: bifunctional enoyl-CoA hydratase/phosphate acetyltransferase [Roseiarcus sp.]|jgi:phosphate acetyltransferase/phosphate butyryltransferase